MRCEVISRRRRLNWIRVVELLHHSFIFFLALSVLQPFNPIIPSKHTSTYRNHIYLECKKWLQIRLMVAEDIEEEKKNRATKKQKKRKKSNRIRFLPLYGHSSSSSSKGCQLLWEDASWRLSLSPSQPISCQAANVAKAHAWGCSMGAGAHSQRPSSRAGWKDGWKDGGREAEEVIVCVWLCVSVHVCMLAKNIFSLFAILRVCLCAYAVAWPEGPHCNGHSTGRERENDETVGRVAGWPAYVLWLSTDWQPHTHTHTAGATHGYFLSATAGRDSLTNKNINITNQPVVYFPPPSPLSFPLMPSFSTHLCLCAPAPVTLISPPP